MALAFLVFLPVIATSFVDLLGWLLTLSELQKLKPSLGSHQCIELCNRSVKVKCNTDVLFPLNLYWMHFM